MVVKKVGIIKGESQYGVMRTWCLELEKGFNKMGIETIVYDLKYHNVFNNYNDIDFYVSFNGWAVGHQEELNFKKPVIMVLADHVIDHLGRIKNLRETDILTVMDRYDDKILNLIGMDKDLYFLPHAALEISYEEIKKDIDCLFLGSFLDPNVFLQKLNKFEGPALVRKFKEIIQDCLDNPKLNYIQYSLEKFDKLGLPISIHNNEVLIELIRIVGRYIYSVRRLEVIKTLADNEVNITIFGNGWENSEIYKHNNIQFENAINFYESQEIIKKSKILLNIQSFLVDGTHERVFAAMANNSVSLSNRTQFLTEEFIEDEEMLFYDFNNITFIVNKLKTIIENEDLRETIIKKAKSKVSSLHTYQKRAQDLVAIYEIHYQKRLC